MENNLREVNDDLMKEWFQFREESKFCYLTEEDKTYLNITWGKSYRPDEQVQLENLYQQMMQSYDIQSAGDVNTLKLACKASLKSN